jgi:hypothetical protein
MRRLRSWLRSAGPDVAEMKGAGERSCSRARRSVLICGGMDDLATHQRCLRGWLGVLRHNSLPMLSMQPHQARAAAVKLSTAWVCLSLVDCNTHSDCTCGMLRHAQERV